MLTDICDTLKGRYPKDFKFTGWHPHCRCHAVTILKTEDEMQEDTQRILAGEKPTQGSVNTVDRVPAAFKDWVEEHSARIEMGGNLPYFIRDNQRRVNNILGLTTIGVGNDEYFLNDLIAQCEAVETTNGKVYLHPNHGKGELAENLEFARWRAEQFGEEVILLPNPQGVKSPDSYNITREVLEEYKRAQSTKFNALDRLIREGAKQADYLIIEPQPMLPTVLADAMTDRVRRTNLKEIRIKIGQCEAVYTREEICKKGFKIKPEDFRNASISRSRGTYPAGNEPGHIAMVDAKVAKFFGLDKKLQQENAIAKIQEAVKAGLLPKEAAAGLKEMSFDAFERRNAFLQKRVAEHAKRTPLDIQNIKDAWAKNLAEKAWTKRSADRVLALAKTWNEVDYSALESLIAQGKLTGMEAETRKVMEALKAKRAEEKVLADLIPNVHGWHKEFSLAELREAHASIQSTLDFWKTKFGADLATDSNLAKLKTELEQKIKFVENPGAFKAGAVQKKTWQVMKDSYTKMLDQVENRIEIIKLIPEYENLLMFKTTSKDFKEYMAKAKAALDAGDTTEAKALLHSANIKKEALEARRGGGGIKFETMAEEKIEALIDQFGTNTVARQDKWLRAWTEKSWATLTEEERFIVTKYTQTYSYLNEPLRGIPYCGDRPKTEFDHDLPILTRALNKIKTPRDMVVRRGVKNYPVKDLDKMLSEVVEGDVMTDKGFLSTACHREKGFFQPIEMIILVPKGARGIYAEPFSHYTDSGCYDFEWDKIWDGEKKQTIGREFEWIGQRGCQFKVLKKTGNRIILQLIGQLK